MGQSHEDKNQFNREIIEKWKIFLNEKQYLENKYKTENKLNVILKFINKYYLYCFNRQGNNSETGLFFKELYKNIDKDKYVMFNKFASKINDFKVSLDLKWQIMYIINFVNETNMKEKKEITFDIFISERKYLRGLPQRYE